MISISRTWRRISTQLKNNLWQSHSNTRRVRFYSIDAVYYTHSSTEYDRTPSEENFSVIDEDN
ncbi:hypothetical protein K501DRAFT_193291 [Backusella circina FSU 941]|nr:hypothetical protein K501DRAFT_193291 [Backusella circina FSU 941]